MTTQLQCVGAHKYEGRLTANYNNRSELTFDFSHLNLIVCILVLLSVCQCHHTICSLYGGEECQTTVVVLLCLQRDIIAEADMDIWQLKHTGGQLPTPTPIPIHIAPRVADQQ